MFTSRYSRFYDRYQLNTAKGNFNLQITEEQFIYQFGDDIQKIFPVFHQIPHEYKLNFANRTLRFLKQYPFIEQKQVSLTNSHKVLIAASYVKLTLGFSTFLINAFDKIIMYPTAQYFPDLNQTHTGHFNPKLKIIMLALDEFERDILLNSDGKDLALHEFTHALCFEMLQSKANHPNFEKFRQGFQKISDWFKITANLNKIEEKSFLRPYAFENKLELVAVLIELFFENEEIFKNNYPVLYFLVGNMINHPKIKSKS